MHTNKMEALKKGRGNRRTASTFFLLKGSVLASCSCCCCSGDTWGHTSVVPARPQDITGKEEGSRGRGNKLQENMQTWRQQAGCKQGEKDKTKSTDTPPFKCFSGYASRPNNPRANSLLFPRCENMTWQASKYHTLLVVNL